jgi:hypothetical protein
MAGWCIHRRLGVFAILLPVWYSSSRSMRKRNLFLLLGALLAIVLAIVAWRGSPPGKHTPPAPGSASELRANVERTTPASGSNEAPVRGTEVRQAQVRRLTSDNRRQLGELIAAARQRAREASSNTATGSAGDDVIPLEQVAKPLKDALTDTIGILAECYKQQPGGGTMRDAAALMTMTSDPGLGTVIDADEIKDADGKPLAASLENCFRDTIDSLALPPLGTGGKLRVQYTFKFD